MGATKIFFNPSIEPTEFIIPSDEDMAAVDITSQLEEELGSPSTNSLLVDAFGGADLSIEGSQQDTSQSGEASFLE